MAVVNVTSTEYGKQTDPRTNGLLKPEEYQIPLFTFPFNVAQGAAAGDITSTQKLVKLPAGRVIIFPRLSRIDWSAFGAARTLAIGVGAYQDETDTTVVAATSVFDSAIDVSAAGGAALGSALAAGAASYSTFLVRNARLGNVITDVTKYGLDVLSTVAGGTIPANATLKGYITAAILGPF